MFQTSIQSFQADEFQKFHHEIKVNISNIRNFLTRQRKLFWTLVHRFLLIPQSNKPITRRRAGFRTRRLDLDHSIFILIRNLAVHSTYIILTLYIWFKLFVLRFRSWCIIRGLTWRNLLVMFSAICGNLLWIFEVLPLDSLAAILINLGFIVLGCILEWKQLAEGKKVHVLSNFPRIFVRWRRKNWFYFAIFEISIK